MLGPWSSTRCKYILVMEIDLKAAVQLGGSPFVGDVWSLQITCLSFVKCKKWSGIDEGWASRVSSVVPSAAGRQLAVAHRPETLLTTTGMTDANLCHSRLHTIMTTIDLRKHQPACEIASFPTVFRLTVLIDSGKQEHEDIRSDTTVQRLNTRCD